MKWLKALLEKIEEFSTESCAVHEPKEEAGEKEKVIGVLPPDLKKFFGYKSDLIDQFNAKIEAHQQLHESSDHTPDMCKKFHEEMEPKKNEMDLLNELFWKEVRAEFGTTADGIGVRKGWKIVEMDPEESFKKGLIDIFRGFPGL